MVFMFYDGVMLTQSLCQRATKGDMPSQNIQDICRAYPTLYKPYLLYQISATDKVRVLQAW